MDTEHVEQPEGNEEKEWLKELRRKAELYDKTVPAMQKDFALLKAEVDLESPVTELFREGYKGDWSKVDEVKVAAQKYGIIKTVSTGTTTETQGTEVHPDAATQQRIDTVSAGSSEPVTTKGDESWKSAGSLEEFMAKYQAAGGVVIED